MRLQYGNRLMVVLASLIMVAASCGDNDSTEDSGAADSGVEITNVWARTSPMQANAGAIYFQITSDSANQLVSASVSPDIAATIELHETVAMDDMESSEDGGSMAAMENDEAGEGEHAMTMRELAEGIALPAGETVSLEPGGMHVMMLDLVAPLETGGIFDLELTFDTGNTATVPVEVRDDAP